jgi:hypothetical protein
VCIWCTVVAFEPIRRLRTRTSWKVGAQIRRVPSHPCGPACCETHPFPLSWFATARQATQLRKLRFRVSLLRPDLVLSLPLPPARDQHEPLVDPDGLATPHAPEGHHPRRQRVGNSDLPSSLSPFPFLESFSPLTFLLISCDPGSGRLP